MKKLYFLSILLLLLTGCSSLKTPEIRGVVVDAETGQPIADARIFAEWRLILSGPGGPSNAGEPKKEIKLKTCQDGRFLIPAYRLMNYYPYPIGQGGYFGFAIIALGYKGKGYGTEQNGAFESGHFKDITIGKENLIKLRPITDPKEWLKNSSDIYGDVKNDKDFLLQEDKMFTDKFGSGRWDKLTQLELFKAYRVLKDYENAKRKAREIIEDFPTETDYVINSLKKLNINLTEE